MQDFPFTAREEILEGNPLVRCQDAVCLLVCYGVELPDDHSHRFRSINLRQFHLAQMYGGHIDFIKQFPYCRRAEHIDIAWSYPHGVIRQCVQKRLHIQMIILFQQRLCEGHRVKFRGWFHRIVLHIVLLSLFLPHYIHLGFQYQAIWFDNLCRGTNNGMRMKYLSFLLKILSDWGLLYTHSV